MDLNDEQPSYIVRQNLSAQLSALENEISSVDAEIDNLRRLREGLVVERNGLLKRLNTTSSRGRQSKPVDRDDHQTRIDYTKTFEWSHAMKARMKSVFKIDTFRLCQEAVCNANMDGRDVVCVMPTGGGKSLTYQLPALLSPGCTLVISPLISLITDQVIHLCEAGVEAVMLTGSTSKEAFRNISSRLTQGPGTQAEIKLCYVTPEKISKSKTFTSMLEKMAMAGRLARIVVDEAHCVSQLGHDFRPDYKKLAILRQLFPRIPILALSATCPPAVLKDLLLVLKLKPVVDGNAASPDGTVYLSAPLYRKNLHYTVVPKPSSPNAMIQTMTNYILDNHKKDSGIVYCLSKKDTEAVAAGIAENSDGKIKTGIYHADVADEAKEALHRRWRRGEIQVMCATIAFGLGIDMATVRFVLHHSISKSLDGFYQESGRAGRDGKDADCVLYYRKQDATRLSSLVCGELGGQEKLHDMLRFAQNVADCRNILFAKYFSASSSISLASWTSSADGTLSSCGHCDNCTRPADTVDRRDTTLEVWKSLKIAQEIERLGGRVTLGMLADIIRGAGGASFNTDGGLKGKRKAKEKIGLDLDEVAGGKVLLSRDDAETLLIQLLLLHYLKEDFHPTAYSINVYLVPGPQAIRLTRLSREDIERGAGTRIQMNFLKGSGRKLGRKVSRNTSTKAKSNSRGNGESQSKLDFASTVTKRANKRKRRASEERLEDDEISEEAEDFIEDDHDVGEDGDLSGSDGSSSEFSLSKTKKSDGESLWTFTMDDEPRTKKRRRNKLPVPAPTSDDEVIILTD